MYWGRYTRKLRKGEEYFSSVVNEKYASVNTCSSSTSSTWLCLILTVEFFVFIFSTHHRQISVKKLSMHQWNPLLLRGSSLCMWRAQFQRLMTLMSQLASGLRETEHESCNRSWRRQRAQDTAKKSVVDIGPNAVRLVNRRKAKPKGDNGARFG